MAVWISLLNPVLERHLKIEETLMVYCYRNKIVPNGVNIIILTLFFEGWKELCQHFIGRFLCVIGLKVIIIFFIIYFSMFSEIKM